MSTNGRYLPITRCFDRSEKLFVQPLFSAATNMSQTLISDLPDIETLNSNIWTFLYPHLQHFKSRVAIVHEKTNKTYTYGDIINGSLRWSKKLIGLYEGSSPPTVAVIISNLAEFPMIVIGAIAAGTPICPILPSYTNEMIAYMLKETQASVIVVEVHFLDKLAAIQKIMGGNIKKPFVLGDNSEGAENVLHIISNGPVDLSAVKMTDPGDTVFIFYSSGTTGKPKGILLSQRSILNSLCNMSHLYIYNIERQEGVQQAIVATVPMTHTFGIQLYNLLSPILGDKVIVIDYSNCDKMIKAAQKYEAKFLNLRPFDVAVLANFENVQKYMSSVKILLVVGSVPNILDLQELHERVPHIKFADIYGLTEVNSLTCTPESADALDIRMKLVPNMKLQIRHTISKEILGPNQVGEICTKSPLMMSGYLHNPEATREAIDEDGWFLTGDVGFYNEDHYITVIERINDVIINSGKTVFPSHIEKVIKQHPSILDVGVLGIPHLLKGQVPRAYIVLKDKDNSFLEEKDIVSYVNDRVSCPEEKLDSVVFLQSLPRNPMGKILKKELRNFDWQENSTSKMYLNTGSGFVAQASSGETK